MRKRPFWSRFQPKLPRRKAGKFSSSRRRTPAWTGLEGIEPRLLLSGSISLWDGAEGTEQISNGDTTPSRLDYTGFGAVEVEGDANLLHSFIIENNGDSDLALTGSPKVIISGDAAADFTVTRYPRATIKPDGGTFFYVVFNPSELGVRNATVAIVSDDPGAPLFTFDIQGTGVDVASSLGTITLWGGADGSQVIAKGDTTPSMSDSTDFGAMGVPSGSLVRTFFIENTAGGWLNLTGISGLEGTDFSVVTTPEKYLAEGDRTFFSISFDPSAAGVSQATVTINSSDPATRSFSFAVHGTGLDTVVLPDGLQYYITEPGTGDPVVEGDNLVVNYTGYLTDGTVFDSSLNEGRYPFYISGIGTAGLITGWNLGLIGMQVGEHRTLIIPPELGYREDGQGDIPPNATLIFEIELRSINDPVELYGGDDYNQYIDLNGEQVPSLAAHTDFGNVAVTGGTAEWSFDLMNFGDEAFPLIGATSITISGANAGDFTVTMQPSEEIAGGQNAAFAIQFNPAALGLRTVTVTVHAEAWNRSFAIQGTGVPNNLSGATEDQPFTISYAALYQAMYGTSPPAGAKAFQIQSVDSGTLTKGGIAVISGTTLIAPGQSLAWKGDANANHTQAAFTVKEWDGTKAVGGAIPIRVEVKPVEDAPIAIGTLPTLTLRPSTNGQVSTLALDQFFNDPDVDFAVVRFTTNMGTFYVNTFSNTPVNTSNFLGYVNEVIGDSTWNYTNSMVHNVTPGSLVQGGTYFRYNDGKLYGIPVLASGGVGMEYGYSNARGTISIARNGAVANGATSLFAFNIADNSASRDGNYTVFGEVMGNSMSVIDAIARLPRQNFGGDFSSVPLIANNPNNPVFVNDVSVVPALTYKVTSSNRNIVATLDQDNKLTLNIAANTTGGGTITVTATDRAGKSITKSFSVVLPVVTISASDAAAAETPVLGANTGAFKVTRTGPTTLPLTVQYGLTGTAANDDYAGLSGSVTIPAGAASATITVRPVNDTAVEAAEIVIATLTDSADLLYRVGAANAATVTIADNDLTTVTVAKVSDASEDSPAVNKGLFSFTRADTIAEPLTVTFARGGTATTGRDYTLRLAGSAQTLTANSVTIPAGLDHMDVELLAVDDVLGELTETAILTVQKGKYVIGTAAASVNIADNEPALTITASKADAAEPNTAGKVTITRTGSTAQPLTVNFTRSGSATAGSDYVTFANTVVIPVGASSADLSIQPLADMLTEADETVKITLAANTAYSLPVAVAERSATVTIIDGTKSAGADLVLTSLTYPAASYSLASLPGKTLTLSGKVLNQGLTALSADTNITFFLSQDRQLGNADDVNLGVYNIANLVAGQTLSFTKTVSLAGLADGMYYVLAKIGLNEWCSPLNNIVIKA